MVTNYIRIYARGRDCQRVALVIIMIITVTYIALIHEDVLSALMYKIVR